MNTKTKITITSILLAAGLLTGWKGENGKGTLKMQPHPEINEVWIQNSELNPTFVTVPINTTVKWVNKDKTKHAVTGITSRFNSGNLDHGGTFKHCFPVRGTYFYHCPIHSNMTGAVIVE